MNEYHPGNQVQLLRSGAEYFPALERAIDGAVKEIQLETYILADDDTGRRIVDALGRAAHRGVEVRVAYDGFGSSAFLGDLGNVMHAAGVTVAVFRPETGWNRFRKSRLRRLHRKLVTVDGVSGDDGDSATLNRALFPAAVTPAAPGVAHSWVFSRAGVTLPALTMTSANITKNPVLSRSMVTALDGKKVGYMVFNDHLATAEAQLVEAVNYFKTQAIDDLVLDVRYNGGGYLYIASEIAYMIAGPTRIQSSVFEQLSYNDKRSAQTNGSAAVWSRLTKPSA